MIICHPLKLIFFKTKKVGGTSFEIALSSFCDFQSIITPISPADEQTRQALGYRGAQNFDQPQWQDGSTSNGVFFNHMTARQAKALIPADIWDSYTKVTIVRDPYDAMISRYFWEGGANTGLDFGTFVSAYRCFLTENTQIAPLGGPAAMDHYLRYDHLEEDVTALGIEDLWQRFTAIRTKSEQRPRQGSSVQDLYAQYPQAVDVVASECQPEIDRFGFKRPVQRQSAANNSGTGQQDFVFTISAGRTGTSWLSKLLAQNLGTSALHEPLGIDDFGTQMPSIRAMRGFNDYGMERTVRAFWDHKFSELKAPYIETNHTLAKCGLVEALAESDLADRTTLIVLRRDLAKQCVSYIMRNDFTNITLDWQWYLSPRYRNVIVNPVAFQALGQIGTALWYCCEMEARQAFYIQKYGDQLNFIEVELEQISTRAGAASLLQALGYDGPVTLPERANANAAAAPPELLSEVRRILEQLPFDPHKMAAKYRAAGRDLSRPPMTRAA